MKKNLITGLVIAGLGVMTTAMPSFAGTATGALVIDATVLGTCLVTPAALSFGSLSAGSTTSNDAETNIDVRCTNGIDPTAISLAPTAATTGRKLTSGTSTVDYELYTTSARSTIWNTTNTVNPDASTTLINPLTVGGATLKVYGRVSTIPSGALLGVYAGAETITVSY